MFAMRKNHISESYLTPWYQFAGVNCAFT